MRATQLLEIEDDPTPCAIESPSTTHNGSDPAIAAWAISRHSDSRGLTCAATDRVPRLITLMVRVNGRGAQGSRACSAATTGW